MMQFMHNTQQQLVEEIRQLKAEKNKEKGSQHDLENVVDKEETPIGSCLQISRDHETLRRRRGSMPTQVLKVPK